MAIINLYQSFDLSTYNFKSFAKADILPDSGSQETRFYVYPKADDGVSPVVTVEGVGFQYFDDGKGHQIPFTGEVNALRTGYYLGSDFSNFHDVFQIHGIDVDVVDVLQAASTKSKDDDLAVLQDALKGDDQFLGSEGSDTMAGYAGKDLFFGGQGKAGDHFDGGKGADIVSYGDSTVGLKLDLSNIDNNTGIAKNDTYASIETFQASNHDDIVKAGIAGSRIDGADGMDVLFGNNGADHFVFSTMLSDHNVDTVKGFEHGVDKITLQVDEHLFAGVKGNADGIKETQFVDVAHDAETKADRIIYDSHTGNLFYDADGSKHQFEAELIATLTKHPGLTASDFEIV